MKKNCFHFSIIPRAKGPLTIRFHLNNFDFDLPIHYKGKFHPSPEFTLGLWTEIYKSNQLTLRSVRWLLVNANVVPSSSILVTLMKEALSSSET
jgi:hypothetical protein